MNFSFISWLCCEMAARHDGREYETWNYPLVGKRIIERKCKMYCSSTCNSVCCVSTLRFLELPFDQWLKTPEGVGSSELLRDHPSPGRGSNLLCWLDLSFWSSLNFISTRAASWILILLLQISFCWAGIPDEIPIRPSLILFGPPVQVLRPSMSRYCDIIPSSGPSSQWSLPASSCSLRMASVATASFLMLIIDQPPDTDHLWLPSS